MYIAAFCHLRSNQSSSSPICLSCMYILARQFIYFWANEPRNCITHSIMITTLLLRISFSSPISFRSHYGLLKASKDLIRLLGLRIAQILQHTLPARLWLLLSLIRLFILRTAQILQHILQQNCDIRYQLLVYLVYGQLKYCNWFFQVTLVIIFSLVRSTDSSNIATHTPARLWLSFPLLMENWL